MLTEINESIKVGAIFGDNKKKLKPVWFVWSGRKYDIKKITYILDGKDKKGQYTPFYGYRWC